MSEEGENKPMPVKKNRSTTIVLSQKATVIKTKYYNAFGLKNLISAGLYLFDGLSAEAQIDLCNQVAVDEAAEKLVAEAEADVAATHKKQDRRGATGRKSA